MVSGANYGYLIWAVLAEAWVKMGPWTPDMYPHVARYVQQRVNEIRAGYGEPAPDPPTPMPFPDGVF